jgi:hypothetical protein
VTVRHGGHDAAVRRARLELEVAELEAGGFAYGLLAAPPPQTGHRDPLPHEAHVDFAGIEADLDAATARIARVALGTRPAVLARLLEQLSGAPSAPAVLDALIGAQVHGLASIPGVADVLASARVAITSELVGVAGAGALRVHDEARRQGVPAARIRPPRVLDATLEHLRQQATIASAAPAAQLIDAAHNTAAATAGPSASVGDVLAGISASTSRLSDAGPTDVVHQAVNRANGMGRGDGADSIDPPEDAGGGAGAMLIYASELIDKATCYPCALVDGTEYPDEAAAAEDYPFGQYESCLGGPRCRGMLVYVWAPEAPATIGMPA